MRPAREGALALALPEVAPRPLPDAAELARLAGWEGIPPELRPVLALVLVRRELERLASLVQAAPPWW